MTEKISLERLNKLHPAVRQSAIEAYLEACRLTPVGVHPFITESGRSFKRSDDLYAQPWDKKDNDGDGKIDEPDEHVTNAKGGDSEHNYLFAIDFVILVNGKENWKVDNNWMIVVDCFKKRGWKWGGDWKGNLIDSPHLENTCGLSLAQIKAKYKAKDFIPGETYINITA